MSGIEAALVTSWATVSIFGIYAIGWKQELNAYRRNEQAKKEIAANSTLEARLLKSGGAVHKY